MAILQQPGTGYRDPSKAMSIKALQSRMKAAQEAAAQATQIQNPIVSPTAGLAHLAGVAAAGFGQSQAENREADARGQLAQIMSGIGPEGPTPQQTALINQLDPDLGGKIFEGAMRAREQEDQQKHAMDLQSGQQTFTAGESKLERDARIAEETRRQGYETTSREDTQTHAVDLSKQGAAQTETAAEAEAGRKEEAAIAANTRADQDARDAAAVAQKQATHEASLKPDAAQRAAAVAAGTMTQAQADAAAAYEQKVAAGELQKLTVEGMTPGDEKTDQDAAPRIEEWRSVGGPGAIKAVSDVKKAMDLLQGGDITGFWQGVNSKVLPSYVSTWLNPEGKIASDSIKNTVQMQLRQVLGAQFTQVEGEGFMERAFDPSLGEGENVRRAKLILDQLVDTAANRQAEMEYWDANGKRLAGFKGRPGGADIIQQLREMAASGPEAPAGGATGGDPAIDEIIRRANEP